MYHGLNKKQEFCFVLFSSHSKRCAQYFYHVNPPLRPSSPPISYVLPTFSIPLIFPLALFVWSTLHLNFTFHFHFHFHFNVSSKLVRFFCDIHHFRHFRLIAARSGLIEKWWWHHSSFLFSVISTLRECVHFCRIFVRFSYVSLRFRLLQYQLISTSISNSGRTNRKGFTRRVVEAPSESGTRIPFTNIEAFLSFNQFYVVCVCVCFFPNNSFISHRV